MKIKVFGRELTLFEKRAAPKDLTTVGGTWQTVMDWWPGAWQQNVSVDAESVLAVPAVFGCITLIADDIGKMRPKLMERDEDGIWSEVSSGSFSPVLRRPNHYQNHIQFKQSWMYSKLSRGNVYALKQRDKRGVVVKLYILDPCRVKPLVTPSGEVYYQVGQDNLSDTAAEIIVPASEIIHDRINCLFHPLVGLSPIFACGLAATKSLKIENNAAKFFTNMSRPGGVLTAPGAISTETADRLKAAFEEKFTGDNAGKVAVLGDGLKYESMTMSAVESQMIEQLKWSSETICSTFHVPPFKLGLGTMPTYQNAEVLNQIYYSDCIQSHVEQYEACMDEGLSLEETKDGGKQLGVELDLDALLRMDQATQIRTLGEAVKGGILSPNEARKKVDQKPKRGGDSVYLQQQNYSLEALAKRDAKDDPFGTAAPAAAPAPKEEPEDPAEQERRLGALVSKAVKEALAPPAAPEFDFAAAAEELKRGLMAA